MSLPELQPSLSTGSEILLVDDDPKTLLAMEAMLGDVGGTLVTARSGREALLKLLTQDFAVILLDVQMPDLDGFETAELIRERDKSRHTPIIFLTAFNQNDRAMLRGYALGAVDFMFKPIVPEILRSKVQVFVDLQRKTDEVQRQARLIREAEAREHARMLGEERQRWEADNLRAQMERERAAASEMARKAEELARAVADRDAAARALVQSNARLALLSDTANRLLTGQRPHELLDELFARLTGHLDLDVYAYRALDDDGLTLTLRSWGGISAEEARRYATMNVLGDGVLGRVVESRTARHRRRRLAARRARPWGRARRHRLRLLSALGRRAAHRHAGVRHQAPPRASRSRSWRCCSSWPIRSRSRSSASGSSTELQARNIELADADRAQGRVPGHAGARAAQPAGADRQRAARRSGSTRTRAAAASRAPTRRWSGRSATSSASSTICSTSRASRRARSSCAASAPSCRRSSSRRCRSRGRLVQAREHALTVEVPEEPHPASWSTSRA